MTEPEYVELAYKPENKFEIGDDVRITRPMLASENVWGLWDYSHIGRLVGYHCKIEKEYRGLYKLMGASRWYPHFVLETIVPSLQEMSKSRFKHFDKLVKTVEDGSYYKPKPKCVNYTWDGSQVWSSTNPTFNETYTYNFIIPTTTRSYINITDF